MVLDKKRALKDVTVKAMNKARSMNKASIPAPSQKSPQKNAPEPAKDTPANLAAFNQFKKISVFFYAFTLILIPILFIFYLISNKNNKNCNYGSTLYCNTEQTYPENIGTGSNVYTVVSTIPSFHSTDPVTVTFPNSITVDYYKTIPSGFKTFPAYPDIGFSIGPVSAAGSFGCSIYYTTDPSSNLQIIRTTEKVLKLSTSQTINNDLITGEDSIVFKGSADCQNSGLFTCVKNGSDAFVQRSVIPLLLEVQAQKQACKNNTSNCFVTDPAIVPPPCKNFYKTEGTDGVSFMWCPNGKNATSMCTGLYGTTGNKDCCIPACTPGIHPPSSKEIYSKIGESDYYVKINGSVDTALTNQASFAGTNSPYTLGHKGKKITGAEAGTICDADTTDSIKSGAIYGEYNIGGGDTEGQANYFTGTKTTKQNDYCNSGTGLKPGFKGFSKFPNTRNGSFNF